MRSIPCFPVKELSLGVEALTTFLEQGVTSCEVFLTTPLLLSVLPGIRFVEQVARSRMIKQADCTLGFST